MSTAEKLERAVSAGRFADAERLTKDYTEELALTLAQTPGRRERLQEALEFLQRLGQIAILQRSHIAKALAPLRNRQAFVQPRSLSRWSLEG